MKDKQKDLWGWKTDFTITNGEYDNLLEKPHIPKDDCIIGGLYLVDGRNMDLAVFNGTGFDYMRQKFGDVFEFVEFHWDDGPPHGTVKPLLLIEDLGRD